MSQTRRTSTRSIRRVAAGAAIAAVAVPVVAQVPSADATAAATTLLFESSDTPAFLARRSLRLALVTPPAAPPQGAPAEWSANPIDRFIWSAWQAAGLAEAASPPGACSDAVFARRVYLDIIGVIPTIDESDRFQNDPRHDKRDRLIDELLARDADYADHWTPFWEDALGSSHVNLQGGVPTRGNYRQWINDSLRANKPYDLFAAELIDTAMPGAKKPETADANGKKSRISYVRNETHTDTVQSAAAAAQVFLGTSTKCASCHNHFENPEWPQTRALALAGMFGPGDLEQIRCEKHTGKVVGAAFPFDLPGVPAGMPADEGGRLRRAAQLITDPSNPRFARAMVNRLWKRYLGLGLMEPADDFRVDVTPSHPELLDWLAYDFMAHGYDLKGTTRLILSSRTYQSRYDPALEDHVDMADRAAPRWYRTPMLRRLTAEQIVDSVRVAAAQKLDGKARLFRKDQSTALSRALGKPASRNEISTARADDAAVVQSLELLNGEEFNALVYGAAGLDSVERVFRAALTRPPTAQEAELAATYLRDGGEAARGDLLWALCSSPEFQYIR